MRVAEPFVQTGLLGEAIDLAPAAVLVADEHGKYVAVNRFACEMLGYTRAELLSLRVHDVSAEPEVEAHYDQFLKDRRAEGLSAVRRKDGSTFDFRYRAGETTIAGLTYYVSVGFPSD
jgi:PAS domain S-box-containing protein